MPWTSPDIGARVSSVSSVFVRNPNLGPLYWRSVSRRLSLSTTKQRLITSRMDCAFLAIYSVIAFPASIRSLLGGQDVDSAVAPLISEIWPGQLFTMWTDSIRVDPNSGAILEVFDPSTFWLVTSAGSQVVHVTTGHLETR